MNMKIDVSKLLQLDYLNALILQYTNKIDKINSSFVKQYNLDMITSMEVDEINKLFNQYNISNDNVLKYLEMDFFDDDWIYADLYSEDREYAKELEVEYKDKAISDIDKLNNKINSVNENNRKIIFQLEKEIDLFRAILKLLNNNVSFLESDIDNLKLLIIDSSLSDSDKFKFSYDIVKYLIENNRKIENVSDKKDTGRNKIVVPDNFEKLLEDAYSTSTYYMDEIKIEESIYSDTILEYYRKYEKLFKKVDLGNSINEIMETASDLARDLSELTDSISMDDFCIRLGDYLNDLNLNKDEETVNAALFGLDELDKFYEENLILSSYKHVLIDDIKKCLYVIEKINIDCLFKDRIKSKFDKLYGELKDNLISSKRKDEITLECTALKSDLKNLSEIELIVDELIKLENEINKMISVGIKMDKQYYDGLSKLQLTVIELKKMILEKGINTDISVVIKDINEKLIKHRNDLKKNKDKEDGKDLFVPKEKINLKGFVLFDIDENNTPYVLDDLNPMNNDMIDKGIETGDLSSGFVDYSNLINDLLLFGKPGIMKDEMPAFIGKILDKVYYNPDNRNHPTGMVRIRPLRNSVVRFIEQRIILSSGTEIHKQVCDIIGEILPSTNISLTDDFVIYINYASALKRDDGDVYNTAINRFDGGSVLRKLFDSSKDRLSDSECDLLRDIVKISVDTYYKLGDINPNLRFDVIKEIGGKKTRG